MASPRTTTNALLLPLAWLYGLGVGVRNLLFDSGLIRQTTFDVPVVCVGNLAVGGTGKTPHTEYIVGLLISRGINVAVLSRGYRRKTSGFVEADATATADDIGDEPFQIYRKYPSTRVAVDADRRQGIARLLTATPRPECIVLDDAYQHRYVRAGMNLLLTDYNRLFADDSLLPAGRLREPASGKRRAHVVIVTKCPDSLRPTDIRAVRTKLNLGPSQQLFFTRTRYGQPYALFPEEAPAPSIGHPEQLLAVAGIARPAPFLSHARTISPSVTPLTYPDHHAFSAADIRRINQAFAALPAPSRALLTTEKDAARLLRQTALSPEVRAALYVQPIEIAFFAGKEQTFNDTILNYVRTH